MPDKSVILLRGINRVFRLLTTPQYVVNVIKTSYFLLLTVDVGVSYSAQKAIYDRMLCSRENGRNLKEKGRKGKEKEKIGSKKVK